MIFDTHIHIGAFGSQPLKGNIISPFFGRELATLNDVQAWMQQNKINKVLAVPHYGPEINSFELNKKLLEWSQKNKSILVGLWANPVEPEATRETLQLANSAAAIKLSPSSWGKQVNPNPATWTHKFKEMMQETVDAAEQNDIPLQIHTGAGSGRIEHYVKFLKLFPNLKLQFIHMGGTAAELFSFVPLFVQWLKEGKQVYCDASNAWGFGLPWLVRELQQEYPQGLNNILFASDYPWGSFEGELAKIQLLPKKVADKILWENAERLYK